MVVPSQRDVPETQNAKTSDHGSASISSLALGIDVTQRGEDVVDVHSSFAELIKRICKNVEPVASVSES